MNRESTAILNKPKSKFRNPFLISFTIIVVLVIIIAFAFDALGLLQDREAVRVDNYVKTTCLVEGFAQYEAYRDHNNYWRGFCLAEFEAYEIPMHPDLNLEQQR